MSKIWNLPFAWFLEEIKEEWTYEILILKIYVDINIFHTYLFLLLIEPCQKWTCS